MRTYKKRLIEKEIILRTKEFPVLVLTGPRQTGKSTLLKHLFPKYTYVTLDDPLLRQQCIEDPSLFLENYKAPLIIDEIQYAPELLPYIKILVDQNREENGSYILTGSQLFPLMQGVGESLAGRAVILELLGFSVSELDIPSHPPRVQDCFEMLYQGFYPEVCVHQADAHHFYRSYIQTYLERDIRQMRSVHDLMLFQKFLELLLARVGNLLNLSEISKECGISQPTAKQWLSLLESTRIIYLLRPYFKNTSKRVVKSPKLYISDTGLLAHILRYSSAETLQHGAISGAIFENFIILEFLKKKFNTNQTYELYFYRDSNQNEIDLIIDQGESQQFYEVKSTKTLKSEHYKTLITHKDLLNIEKGFVISHSPETIKVKSHIQMCPWWTIP